MFVNIAIKKLGDKYTCSISAAKEMRRESLKEVFVTVGPISGSDLYDVLIALKFAERDIWDAFSIADH